MSVAELAEAYANGDIPSVWTPAHVQARLVEAFDVLKRTPARIGPATGGNGWPQIVRDFAELIDEEKYADALATGQSRTIEGMLDLMEQEAKEILTREAHADLARSKLPTALEASKADEALAWGMEHLQGAPLQSHALHFWALCQAMNWKAAPILRKRAVRADAMVSYRRERQRSEIIAKWTAWANEGLGGRLRRAEAINQAAVDLAGLPRVRRSDVMPDRVFTKQWLDINRKRGAALLAKRLADAKVRVR
jgi:hypothetical protein